VEHHKRSPFYQQANSELPDEFVEDDGTVVKYESTIEQSTYGREGEGAKEPLLIREESEDGKTITLRNFIPEHLLANTLTCIRNEEYGLIYEQLLAESTRQTYESEGGGGFEEFARFFAKHRQELAATLNRMMLGIPSQATDLRPMPGGRFRCTFRPQVAPTVKFKTVEMVKEGVELKLVVIR